MAAEGPDDAARLRHLVERLDVPLVAHEVKPLLVARFAEDPAAQPTPIAFDTQIAAYILNASLRSQTIADVVAEQLDLILPPAKELPAVRPRRARGAVGDRRPRPARRGPRARGPRPAVPRDRAAADHRSWPGWRRRASPSTARRWRRSTSSSGPRSSGSSGEIYASVGHEFNLGSPKQLEQVLFFELNLPKGKRTKTGYSTDASVLEELRAAHPMVEGLLEWRTYTKLRSTYVEALPTLIASDGRLHTTFHQAVAATGRLSLVRPEPPEHPDPDAARPADPAGVRGRRART